jgi:phage head maturation protease
MARKYDFAGWATRNNLKCSDGRTIRHDAFKECDGKTVPLVWNHQHNDSDNVLGHAVLENRSDGVYAYGYFNDTEKGQNAKLLVEHGDITGLSIYANKLKQVGGDVLHGVIREVSLVLAGANPGAFIESVMSHSDGSNDEEEALLYYAGEDIELAHSDSDDDDDDDDEKDISLIHDGEEKKEAKKEEKQVADKTIKDVIDSMSEEQKNVMYALIGMAVEDLKGDNDGKEKEDMKHNVFDNELEGDVISHSDMEAIAADFKRYGSLKDTFLEHGIENIGELFPDYKNVRNDIPFINTNPSGWINVVLNGVHHTPFAKVKMVFADITMDTARAKGYIKGNKKVDEVFKLLKRKVDPTTIYKKQSFDRDDVIDITDLDLIAWVKKEMRVKLDEERARAYLFGDGRVVSDADKIDETKIIPVIADTAENLYAMKVEVKPGTDETVSAALVRSLVKGMDNYEGSGNVTAFLRADIVSDLLLTEDKIGHRLYNDINALAAAMAVDKVVKVPANVIPDGFYGVALDLNDYNVGTNKGGEVNLFDDFDIDYNQQKYLIETRQSGALIMPHSAVVLAEPTTETA